MPPTDAERSAVRTNAAPRTDRLPLRGDIHGNRDPRAGDYSSHQALGPADAVSPLAAPSATVRVADLLM